MNLGKTEILLIRACGTHDPVKRLISVYNHEYIKDPKMTDEIRVMYLANIMLRLIENLEVPVDLVRMYNAMAPSSRMYEIHAGDEKDSYWLTVLKWCISTIRYSVDKQELVEKNDFIPPTRFKKSLLKRED